jgi:outer membrane protein assembly factor BamB
MTRTKRCAAVLAVLGLLPLSGCWWGQRNFSSGWTSYNPFEQTLSVATVQDIGQQWHADVPAAEAHPFVSWRDRVLIYSGNAVVALDTATGEQVWSAAMGNGFHPIRDGVLYTREPFDPTQCPPGGPALLAWDVATGERLPAEDLHAWDDEGCDGPDNVIGMGARHALLRGYHMEATGDPQQPYESVYTLRAYDIESATSTSVRSTSLDDRVGPLDEVGERYYTIGPAGGIGGQEVLEARSLDGQVIWTSNVSVANPAQTAVGDGRLYVGNRYEFGYEGFYVFDTETGDELWRGLVDGTMAEPAVRDGALYTGVVSTEDGPLLAFEDCGLAECLPTWIGTGPGRVVQVIAAGDLVYAVGRDDDSNSVGIRIYAADGCGTATCAPLRTITVPGPHADAIVSSGRLLVATPDGVTAYGVPG